MSISRHIVGELSSGEQEIKERSIYIYYLQLRPLFQVSNSSPEYPGMNVQQGGGR